MTIGTPGIFLFFIFFTTRHCKALFYTVVVRLESRENLTRLMKQRSMEKRLKFRCSFILNSTEPLTELHRLQFDDKSVYVSRPLTFTCTHTPPPLLSLPSRQAPTCRFAKPKARPAAPRRWRSATWWRRAATWSPACRWSARTSSVSSSRMPPYSKVGKQRPRFI